LEASCFGFGHGANVVCLASHAWLANRTRRGFDAEFAKWNAKFREEAAGLSAAQDDEAVLLRLR
jgi:hypothetical protein